MEICDILKGINTIGLNLKEHKDVFFTFSVLIATIYIPLVMELLKKVSENKLDLSLFLKDKFDLLKIILLYVSIFILLLFWQKDGNYWLNFILSIILIIPILGLILKLIKINNFFLIDSRDYNKERINYLSKLSLHEKEIWLDSFNLEMLKEFNFSTEFTKILFEKIGSYISDISDNDSITKHNQIEHIRTLLISYNNIENNAIFNSFYNNENLELFLNLYKKNYEQQSNKNYIWIQGDLNNVIETKLSKLSFNNYGIYAFYEVVKKHINNNKTNILYIKYFLETLLNIYLNNNKILNNSELIEEFPYKIKNKNSNSELDKLIQNILLNKTFHYIIDNIQKHYNDEKIDYNSGIDNILRHWYTNFDDLILFSEILTILFTPYGDNRAESIINSKRTFGHIGRVKSFEGEISSLDMSKNYENEYSNTIGEFKNFFPGLINEENFKSLIYQFDYIIEENKLENKKILRVKYYKKILEDLIKQH